MIQKFNQFINESVNEHEPLSVHETINKPFADFIFTAQDRLDTFISRLTDLLHDMDVAIETTKEELSDVIIGEPTITVNKLSYLSDITVEFRTNVPNNNEAWAADESTTLELERRVNDLLDKNEVSAEINYKPDEDGNCIVVLHIYVLDEKNFGEFTDAFIKFGE